MTDEAKTLHVKFMDGKEVFCHVWPDIRSKPQRKGNPFVFLKTKDPRLTEFSIERHVDFSDGNMVQAKFRWNGKRGGVVRKVTEILLFDESALKDYLCDEVIAWATDQEAQVEAEASLIQSIALIEAESDE